MSVEIVSGKLIAANGVATHVECGFIPDHIQLIKDLGGTEKHFKFMRVLYEHAVTATGKYGYDIDGVPANLAGADDGFIPYDTDIDSVLLPAPDGDGVVPAASIADYDDAEAAYVARDLSAGVEVLGSVVRPTVHNGYVYECIVSGGAGVTEPTWPTKVGDTVSDNANTWICRAERTVKRGVKGFTIGATLSIDGQYWFFKAEKHDRFNFMGDADVENPVTFGDHMR